MSFLKQWGLLLLVGDTWLGRVLRWAVLLGNLGLLKSESPPVGIEIRWADLFVISIAPPVGQTLVGMVVIVCLLLTASPAWVRARSPLLWVSKELEEDKEFRMFRLRVENRGAGAIRPEVLVTEVVDKEGAPLIERAQLPLELCWSFETDGQRPELRNGSPRTVTVLQFHLSNRLVTVGDWTAPDQGSVQFMGMRGQRPVVETFRDSTDGYEYSRGVGFIVRVAASGTRPVTREFRIEPDRASSPLFHWVKR